MLRAFIKSDRLKKRANALLGLCKSALAARGAFTEVFLDRLLHDIPVRFRVDIYLALGAVHELQVLRWLRAVFVLV